MKAIFDLAAPAKLNLFLHVTGRRDDGYHLLETLMVAIDAGDSITLTLRDDGALRRDRLITKVFENEVPIEFIGTRRRSPSAAECPLPRTPRPQ